VEKRTEDRIQNLIRKGDLSALTLLVLANANYLKGNWASQFDPALTRDTPFWVAAGEAVTVPMMAQTRTFRANPPLPLFDPGERLRQHPVYGTGGKSSRVVAPTGPQPGAIANWRLPVTMLTVTGSSEPPG